MSEFNFGGNRVVDINAKAGVRIFGMVALAFFVLIFIWSSVAFVPTGNVGVLTLFGRVTGSVLSEGIHLANPLTVNNILSVRTQEIKESASVPSNEGLIITMDTSLLFHLEPGQASEVFRSLGQNYAAVIVEPNLRSVIREVTSMHSANALYSGEREKVSQQILSGLRTELQKRGIMVENILLRDIQLPAALKTSIETKQQAEQESLAMSFRLQKETQEAERKRIEAAGIRDFQQIVAQGISAQLLEWKGIEATEKLAGSSNAKVIVIGGSKNGLPLILGQ